MIHLSIDVTEQHMISTSRTRSTSSYGPGRCIPTTGALSQRGWYLPRHFYLRSRIGHTRIKRKGISNRHSRTGITICLLAACFCGSCGPGGSVVSGSTHAGFGGPMRESRCDTSDGEVTSLVVDWSASERTNLGAAAARGLVFVRVDECDMKILSRCTLGIGSYKYQSVPPKPQHETYRDEGALYTSMPFGVARLAGHLSGSSFLDLNMTMVGQYTSDRVAVAVETLPGDCAGATHMIASYNVGAFELRAVDAAGASGSGSALGGEVGGDKTSHSGWSTSDGDLGACKAGGSVQIPAELCSSPISVTLVPLSGRASPAVAVLSEPRSVPSKPTGSKGSGSGQSGGGPGTVVRKEPNPTQTNPGRAERSKGRDVNHIAVAGLRTCAVSRLGGVKCWGDNRNGQLGDGTKVLRLVPTPVASLGSGVSAIAAGDSHTCALKATGAVMCWGNNSQGRLGDGTTAARLVPTPVARLSSGVSAIAAGDSHTCALKATGAVVCWGNNHYGALGDRTTVDRLAPTPVAGLGSEVSDIAAGGGHTCALKATGAVVCWGNNNKGQLGDGTTVDRLVPTPVVGLGSGVAAIAAGYQFTCASKSTGAVACWGDNGNGQLGDGTRVGRLVPTPDASLGLGVSAIAAATYHTCVLQSAGGVLCWGDNAVGQLGDGSTDSRVSPTPVAGLGSGVSAIAADAQHTCAMKSTGSVVCWGSNIFGQLGDGTKVNRPVPTPVVGYP